MKRFILLAALFSFASYAEGSSANSNSCEARNPSALSFSDDAVEIANILSDTGLKECLDQVRDSVFEVRWNSIASEKKAPIQTQYILSGTAFEGGDMARGPAFLIIDETLARGVHGPVKVFMCDVLLPDAE